MQVNPSFSLEQSAQYFPFQSGVYNTDPGLYRLGKDFGNGKADHRIFQLNDNWQHYQANKQLCRKENIYKYFLQREAKEDSQIIVCRFIIQKLLQDYPDIFTLKKDQGISLFYNRLSQEIIRIDGNGKLLAPTSYLNLFDALANQLQEDLAVWQLEEDQDWMSAIHLCAPNHWAPADKVGSPFSEVHMPVAGMEKMRARYQPMLNSLLKAGSFVRFAWGLATDRQLNHHPIAPPGVDQASWQGRSFDPKNSELFVRVERQTLTGFPDAQAVLFTIRTYFEDVSSLSVSQKSSLREALESMSEPSIAYKGLSEDYKEVINFLS